MLFVLAHYQYKGPLMNMISDFLNNKNHTTKAKGIEHATQTQAEDDSEAACCSEEESSEGSSKMETDVSQSSCQSDARSHQTAVEMLGYDYNMYRGP
jgi:hypothetical protein